MRIPFEVKTAMDEEPGRALAGRNAKIFRFARRFSRVKEYLAVAFAEREREDICGIVFAAMRFIERTRQTVAAEYEREFIAAGKDATRHIFERNSFGPIRKRHASKRARNVHRCSLMHLEYV